MKDITWLQTTVLQTQITVCAPEARAKYHGPAAFSASLLLFMTMKAI
jgi:hypothetical protein